MTCRGGECFAAVASAGFGLFRGGRVGGWCTYLGKANDLDIPSSSAHGGDGLAQCNAVQTAFDGESLVVSRQAYDCLAGPEHIPDIGAAIFRDRAEQAAVWRP